MKEQEHRNHGRIKYIGQRVKNNLREDADCYIICCIPVLPFCLSAHMLLYLSEESGWETGGFENCMLLLSGVLLFICLALFRYSLKTYLRQKSEYYNVLLLLGITSRDFWIQFMMEYCPVFLHLLSCTALGSGVLCDLCMRVVFGNIRAAIFLRSWKTTACLILLFVIGMVGSILVLAIRQLRKDLPQYLADISCGKETLHRFRIAYGMKIAIAFGCLLGSFYLLYDYSVGKMLLAAFLHMTGVYFLLQTNGRLVKKLFVYRKKVYFNHLLRWNDLIYECRRNGNIIFAVYGVNFLSVFLFGGLLASDFPEDTVYTVMKTMTMVIGLSVVLEGQAFVLEKMLLDLHSEEERRDTLFQIGMEWKAYWKLLQDKLKTILLLPMAAASVTGVIFFLCDYIYQEDVAAVEELWNFTLVKYGGAVAIFWAVQYIGYLFLRRRLFQKYRVMADEDIY